MGPYVGGADLYNPPPPPPERPAAMPTDQRLPDFTELRRRFEEVAHCTELGMKVVELRPGEAFMSLDYQDRLVADAATGRLHGGVVTTLMDTVCGLAIMSLLRQRFPVATLDLRIDYLSPATPGETLLAYAECYKKTRRVAFVRGVAYHDTVDDPIANCASTYMVRGTRVEDD